MRQVYLGNTLINDSFLGSNRVSDFIQEILPDPDATAFLTAADITDSTISSAINTLVVELKDAGVWDRFYSIWPFVGGTATTHKYNLKDPRDLDAAFRLGFNGTWVHDSNGVTSNGTDAYADTYLAPNDRTNWATDSSIGIYSRTEDASGYDMGSRDFGAGAQQTIIIVRFTPNDGFYNGLPLGDGTGGAFIENLDGRGFYQIGRDGTTRTWYKNNTKVLSDTGPTYSNVSGRNMVLAAFRNFNIIEAYSERNYALAYVGKSFTDSQNESINTIVQKFQTTLGRQV